MSYLDVSKGYYIVGEKVFYLKYDAMVESTRTGKHIEWNFNYSTFAKQAKMPRLNIPILELYKRRAQQLRDTNDYVILAFSGGADSQTILDAFLDNNIKLDEIWVDHQASMIDKSNYVLTTDKSAINLPSEWFLVIKPKLDEIAKTHPNIKIHVSDACESLMYNNDSTIITNASLNLGYTASYHGLKRWGYIADYAEKLRDRFANVCVIMGMEKCIPHIDDTLQYGFIFTDAPLFFKSAMIEYFYWTPDMPEIAVEQAHYVWDYLKVNRAYLDDILYYRLQAPGTWFLSRKNSFDSIVKHVVYPAWDHTVHQVNKQTIFNGEGSGYYTELFRGEAFYDRWVSERKSSLSLIDLRANFYKAGNLYDINRHTNIHILGKL
jgi:hypothetical protein